MEEKYSDVWTNFTGLPRLKAAIRNWFFHEQIFCGEQDDPLKLTDGRSVHKGIWLLLAQPFYAELEYPESCV